MGKVLGLCLAALHFISVLAVAYSVGTSDDAGSVMAWFLYLVVDFPVIYGMVPLSHLIDGPALLSTLNAAGEYQIYRDIDHFWLPAVYIGVVGTVWWYYLPCMVMRASAFLYLLLQRMSRRSRDFIRREAL